MERQSANEYWREWFEREIEAYRRACETGELYPPEDPRPLEELWADQDRLTAEIARLPMRKGRIAVES